MARVVEYKIWDYTLKKMINSRNIKYNQFPKNGIYYKSYENKRSTISAFFEYEELQQQKRFRFLQYIGKKDMNGKKIFEYDVVKNLGGLIGVIYYNDDKCKYEIIWENGCISDVIDNLTIKGNAVEDKSLRAKFRWIGLKGV